MRVEGQNQQVTNGKAIASMILGILSIVTPYIGLILGIIGIIFARKSFREINEHHQNGKGMAIAGLTTSIVGLCLYALILVFYTLFGIAFYYSSR